MGKTENFKGRHAFQMANLSSNSRTTAPPAGWNAKFHRGHIACLRETKEK
jgi:hypothetical protein